MKQIGWMLVVGAGWALTACDRGDGAKSADKDADGQSQASGDTDDEDGSTKKKKKKKKKKKGKSDDGPADDGDSAGATSCGPLSTIPDIPSGRSKPPTLAEWGQACDVNTQGAGSHPGNCTMKIKREWLQVTCRGNMTGYEQFEGFGSLGLDYFEQHRVGQMASFVVRLRKGQSQKVRMCRNKERASLFVSWPPSAPKPTIVALGVGPKCDGSSWGKHH